jgi:uridine kinase
MKKRFLIIILIFTAAACKNNSQSSSSANQQQDSAQKEFYPISSFIQAQLKKLDSLPLAIIKYTTINNQTDTAIMEKKDFVAVAGYFATPDITAANIKNQFDETSFIDASIQTISLTYLPKNDTIS